MEKTVFLESAIAVIDYHIKEKVSQELRERFDNLCSLKGDDAKDKLEELYKTKVPKVATFRKITFLQNFYSKKAFVISAFDFQKIFDSVQDIKKSCSEEFSTFSNWLENEYS